MGFPIDVGPEQLFSDRDLRGLAGEAYSMPWVATIHLLLYNNPFGFWWGEEFRQ